MLESNKWIQYLGVLLFCFSQIVLHAETKTTFQHRTINNSNGLSNGAVTCVYRDSKGYMWFGTWDGLNRYDGSNLTVFRPDTFVEGSLSNNIIRNIFEDGNNQLWVVTEDGLNRYDRNTEQFSHYLTGLNSKPFIENRIKTSLLGDSVVICAVFGHGLFLYNGSGFQKLDNTDSLSLKHIVGLSYFNHSVYVINNNKSVQVFSYHNNSLSLKRSISLVNVTLDESNNHFFSYKNELWLAVILTDGGLLLINPESGRKYEILKGDTEFLVTALSGISEAGDLMVGTDAGSVFNIDLSHGAEVSNVSHLFPEISQRSVKIWCIKTDNPNITWFGTDGYGVMEYYYSGKYFRKISLGDPNKGFLSHNIIRAIYESKNGDIYVGTRGSGLNCINIKSGKTVVYNKQGGLSDNAVLSLTEDKYHNIWIGVDGEGVDVLDVRSGVIQHFPRDFNNADRPDFGHVYSICMDSYGDIWLGTSGNGVVKLEVIREPDGSYQLKHWQQILSTENGLQSDIVYSIVEAEPNVLWIGSRGGGVQRYNILTKGFEIFRAQEDLASITNDDVLTLFMASTQKLWVGSSGGLTLIDQSSTPYKFVHYNKTNGLPSNTVHAIQQDEDGNLWISTNNGLSRMNPETGDIWNFNDSDGLGNYEYSDNSSCLGQYSGHLYFGGTNGIDVFSPKEIQLSDNNPPLVFTDFYLNQQEQIIGGVLHHNIDLTDTIILNYDQNFFGFSFTSLNYHNKTKVEYAYKLDDFNKDWVYIKDNSVVSFTNVPPGKYIFKVRWSNEDGVWSTDQRQIRVVVNPPWWHTLWAYILYIVLFFVLVTLIVSYFLARHNAKTNMKIKEIELDNAKKLNQYKLQFFTNIAHEFRTPLTLIMAPAIHLLNLKDKDIQSTPYLQSIHENSKRLLHLIGELTDFRKVETSTKKLKVAQVDIFFFARQIFETFLYYAKSHGISLHLNLTGAYQEGWMDSNVMEKILVNLISNAIKFTPVDGNIWINVNRMDDDRLRIEVKDTGIGFSEYLHSKIFDRFFYVTEDKNKQWSGGGSGVGLALTKSLVQLHKGKIVVDSEPQKGSVFTVEIPIGEDAFVEDEKESGSLVISEDIDQCISDEFIAAEQLFSSQEITETSDDERITILIADDNPEIRRLVIHLMKNEFHFIEAENGRQALSLMDENAIDLVISDIIMPELDGLSLCKIIKEGFETCHIPVILLTAKGDLENRIDGISVGADSYIPKPFDPRHLRARINQLIEVREKIRSHIKDDPDKSGRELLGLDAKDAKFMEKFQNYISENLSNPDLDAEMMKDHLGLSKTLLYKKTKALTTLTPHGYLKHYRMKKAAQLLLESDANVSEIIYEVGFNNRTYFYRAFKEMYHCSPKDYQAQN